MKTAAHADLKIVDIRAYPTSFPVPSELRVTLASVEAKEGFGKSGIDVAAGTPEQFGEFLRAEVARWAKVIQEAGIKAD